MKKYIKLFLLFMAIFCLVGCTNIYDLDYDSLIDNTFALKNVKKNTFLEGYKLYLPPHMTLIGDFNNNVTLYSYGDKYFLYTDLISYYNKKENKYVIDKNSYEYSKEFIYDKKSGYVIVSEAKGGKLVEIMYNYAKIEVVTNDVKRAIVSSLVVLKNIKYNYKIINSMIGTNALVYDSEQFSLLGPNTESSDSFLTYEKEFGKYDEKKNKDEDVIDYDESE